MPLYEYRCENCGRKFELRRSISDRDAGLVCPECASVEISRVLPQFAAFGSADSSGESARSLGASGCAGCAGGSCASCGVSH